VLQAVAVTAGVVVVSFALVRIVPGDAATTLLGSRASAETIAALREQLGLDLPWTEQFTSFLSTLFTTGDTGESIVYGVPVRDMILSRVGVTLTLLISAVVVAIIISVPLAILAANYRDGAWDHIVRVFTTLSLTAPAFWIGLILILIFAVRLGWFPVGGDREGFPLSFVLPAITASLTIAPQLTRSLRLQLVEVMDSDFVLTYRAVHYSRQRIMVGHVLRNSLLPFMTLLGMNIAYLIGGALIIERVFDLDGLGGLMFTAISNRDLPVIQGTLIYTAIAVVLVTTVMGTLTAALDPRVRRR
jgi:peptide/nickel transport system permease protein